MRYISQIKNDKTLYVVNGGHWIPFVHSTFRIQMFNWFLSDRHRRRRRRRIHSACRHRVRDQLSSIVLVAATDADHLWSSQVDAYVIAALSSLATRWATLHKCKWNVFLCGSRMIREFVSIRIEFNWVEENVHWNRTSSRSIVMPKTSVSVLFATAQHTSVSSKLNYWNCLEKFAGTSPFPVPAFN